MGGVGDDRAFGGLWWYDAAEGGVAEPKPGEVRCDHPLRVADSCQVPPAQEVQVAARSRSEATSISSVPPGSHNNVVAATAAPLVYLRHNPAYNSTSAGPQHSAELMSLLKCKPPIAAARPAASAATNAREFAGQQHFLGEGKLLRRLLAADRLNRCVLDHRAQGKTTLAKLLAQASRAKFVELSTCQWREDLRQYSTRRATD